MMTKKHFKEIAAAIKASKRPATAETDASIGELAARLATIFATENPRFDRTRLLKACGVEQ